MERFDRSTKTFFLTAVALSLGVSNIAFNLGAFGTIFYDKILAVWAISTAVLLANLAMTKAKRPVSRFGLFALSTPTLWIVLHIFNNTKIKWSLLDEAIFAVSLIILSIALPYAAYVLVSVTQSDALRITPQYLLGALVGIAVLIGTLSFLLGLNNDLVLTCQDFADAGAALPENCHTN